MNLRESVFSGSWYPSSRQACEDQIQQFIEEGKNRSLSVENPVGGIVPHAGWYFSGSIACNVIHRLARSASPDVVVVFGMHLHSGSPRYIMPVDTALAGELTRYSFELENGQHHRDPFRSPLPWTPPWPDLN